MTPFSSKLVVLGRLCFALAIAGFGIQQLIHGEFLTRALPAWPGWIPGTAFWARALGVTLAVAGVAMAARRFGRRAAILVATMILLSAVVVHFPAAVANPTAGQLWTRLGKGLALGGGALLIAASHPLDLGSPTDRVFIVIGRVLFGGFLILAGVQHFLYVDFVATLVPAWAGQPVFWTYFTAIALIGAGASIVFGPLLRWAALLAGGMIFVWLATVHLPRALADLSDANETTAVFEALAFGGLGLMLAAISCSSVEPEASASAS